MNKIDLNVNNTNCLKEVTNIGSTTYQNVCNGTAAQVRWGTLDWIPFIVFGLILIVLVGCIVKMVRS